MSSLRFFTKQQEDFVALGFNSLHTYISQDISNENVDELIEDESNVDEVYAEEDFD